MGSKANCDCHGHHLQGFYYTPLHILFPVIHTAAVFRVSSIHHYMSCSWSFTQLQSSFLGSPLYITTCPVPGHTHSCSPHLWGLLCTSQHVPFSIIYTGAVTVFRVCSLHYYVLSPVIPTAAGLVFRGFIVPHALSPVIPTAADPVFRGFIVPHALSPVIQVAAIPVFRGFHCTSLYALSPVIQTAGVPLLRCFIIYHCHASLPVTQEAAVQSNLIQWCDGVAQ